MVKIFLIAAFPDQFDLSHQRIKPAFKTKLQYILHGLRQEGVTVSCTLEMDNWQLLEQLPEINLVQDIEAIDASDLVVAVAEDKPSAGVQFELGYAAAKGKRVILARSSNDELSWFNQGTIGSGLVQHVTYQTMEMLLLQLVAAVRVLA